MSRSHHHDHHDEDDRHDLGLAFDLGTMGIDLSAAPSELALPDPAPARSAVPGPPSVGRRGALKLLAGAAGGLALAACNRGAGTSGATTSTTSARSGSSTSTTAAGATTSTSGATTSTTSSSSTGGATTSTTAPTTSTTAGSTSEVTTAIPSETGGPYPADGTNGPNVLTQSGIVRSDIRSSFGSSTGTATGVPLDIVLKVVHAGTGAAYAGAAVYLWHCDQVGRYSLYSSGATNQNYLRGIQAADGQGLLAFRSIFPGAYAGRYPHIHFEVFSSLAAATSATGKVKTSQLALPTAACETVYATSGYSQSKANLAQTPISRDGIFSDGYSLQMATVTGTASGMTATLTVAV